MWQALEPRTRATSSASTPGCRAPVVRSSSICFRRWVSSSRCSSVASRSMPGNRPSSASEPACRSPSTKSRVNCSCQTFHRGPRTTWKANSSARIRLSSPTARSVPLSAAAVRPRLRGCSATTRRHRSACHRDGTGGRTPCARRRLASIPPCLPARRAAASRSCRSLRSSTGSCGAERASA